MDKYVTQTDTVPEFFNFIHSLRADDLVAELLQNEIDAKSTHTIFDFGPDRLTCSGNGDLVDDEGWLRLTYLRGAGDEVPQKKGLIGIKNHGLKACFTIGDWIYVRSGQKQTHQTLYRDGEDKPPKPAALLEPAADPAGTERGCTIEVPYRQKQLVSRSGERVVLAAPSEASIEALFSDAVASLATRFIGTLRPDIRPSHVIELRHHKLGAAKFSFAAARALKKGTFEVFVRTCDVSGPNGSSVLRERVATRKIARPSGPQHDVPAFYARKSRLAIEVAWGEVGRRIVAQRGELRYPIGYVPNGASSSSGFAAHYSAPFASDTERHGLAAQAKPWNDHLIASCDGLLVDCISWLVDRPDVRALDLLGSDFAPSDRLAPLAVALADARALPAIPPRTRSKAVKTKTRRRWTRILIPSLKSDPARHSAALADVAPPEDWLLAPATPNRLRELLIEASFAGWCDNRISFDETDALERLRPVDPDEDVYFPWASDGERRRAISNVALVRRHLDALIEGATVPAPADDIELPDTCGVATPLSEMMLASALPTDLPGISLPKLIHPDIAGHPIFRTKEWSRPHFGFRELLADIADKPLRTSAAKQLFTWLVQNPTEFPKQAWPAIKELPIWLDSGGTPRPLSRLCQPKSNALARVLGTALARPHVDIGRLRSALSRRRLSLPVRDLPDENEVAGWLTSRINILPLGQVLGLHEALRYRRLARDLAILTNSPARASLARMSPPPTLARDGTLRRRTTVVSPSAAVDRLDLLPEHVAANRSEAGGKTWPMLDAPTGEMARAALITDPGNSAALLARLKVIADHVEAGDLGISNLLCIPHYGGLLAPNALAFKGNRGDYWGSFRLPISGKNLSQTDQNLFRRAGVLPAEPNPETSRAFFAWLREDASRIEIQLPQIIRHFAHERGATGWWGIYDSEPCLPVDTARGVELVGHRAATRARSVYVKDHQALARAILADPGPIMLAIDKHEQVTSSITHILLKAGVRSLRHQTRDPMHVTGAGVEPAPTWVADILATLTSKRTAKSLEKQLDQYGVTSNLIHAHWPSRLAAIKRIVTAAQVVASYRLGHRQVATEVDHAFDAEQGTLWLKLTGNEMRRSVETALFAAFAERVFVEVAPLWCGPALAAALHADIVEAKAAPVEQASAKIEGVLYSDDHDDEDEEGEPGEAPSGHYDWVPDPSKNLPNPGDLPDNDGKPKPDKAIDKDRQKKRERPSVAGEEAQIRALKQDHYAFHCQISLASSLPGKLAPRGSYVDLAENRSQMIDAHHPDYAGASGARHAGNLLILSHAEHHRIGRKLSREQIRRALQTARPHNVVFRWGTQTRNVDGVIADVVVHSTGEVVSIFFTLAHRDYWLR